MRGALVLMSVMYLVVVNTEKNILEILKTPFGKFTGGCFLFKTIRLIVVHL